MLCLPLKLKSGDRAIRKVKVIRLVSLLRDFGIDVEVSVILNNFGVLLRI